MAQGNCGSVDSGGAKLRALGKAGKRKKISGSVSVAGKPRKKTRSRKGARSSDPSVFSPTKRSKERTSEEKETLSSKLSSIASGVQPGTTTISKAISAAVSGATVGAFVGEQFGKRRKKKKRNDS